MSRFIDAHRDRFGVEPICQVLQVAPSTYYGARCRPPSARQVRDEALKCAHVLRTLDVTQTALQRLASGARKVSLAPADRPEDASAVEQAAANVGHDIDGAVRASPCAMRRKNRPMRTTFAVLEPTADGFRGYLVQPPVRC